MINVKFEFYLIEMLSNFMLIFFVLVLISSNEYGLIGNFSRFLSFYRVCFWKKLFYGFISFFKLGCCGLIIFEKFLYVLLLKKFLIYGVRNVSGFNYYIGKN